MATIVKTQKLSNEAQNLFVELVKISLSKYKKVTLNMVANNIQFYANLTPFNSVSLNYLTTLCHNKGVKAIA